MKTKGIIAESTVFSRILLLTTWSQSHYREVSRWEIFMDQELRFGLDLGWIWAGLATFEAGFFMFSWAKKNLKTL